MTTATYVIRNFYRDSVALMQISSQLSALPGIRQAAVVMASEMNLTLLRKAGLEPGTEAAGPNDLLIAVEGDSGDATDAAVTRAREALDRKPAPPSSGAAAAEPPHSLEMGLEAMPGASIALISTPGDYAAAEAEKALRLGLDVMMFSDNVALADEIALKRYAKAHDLLVMGPDCGTAIISGIPLGFANVVRRGPIGAVAASGTGLQAVTCLIDRLGLGISHAIGTGGHDLHKDVGGITMLQGLQALADDAGTRVIVLISKPPAPEVASRVLEAASRVGKPVVVNFLGADPKTVVAPGLHFAATLESAARIAAGIAGGRPAGDFPTPAATFRPFAASQRYVRGLYSGGTFCYEAALLLGGELSPVYSNTPVGPAKRLDDVWTSRAHTLVDLGDDEFTRGRPHPMIDHRLRNERIAHEASDPETAVILLDVVLGYGSHPDPAGEVGPAVSQAIARAAAAGRSLAVIGFVCGTEGDPQNLARQQASLSAAGMVLTHSSTQAVRLAARIVREAAAPVQAAAAGRAS